MIETLRKDPNLSLGEIAARFGVSRSTLYRNGLEMRVDPEPIKASRVLIASLVDSERLYAK
jgi:hypothetical protein